MKYIGKSNIALRKLINVFGAESIKSLGKFYSIPNRDINNIFTRNNKGVFNISYDLLMVVMTSKRLNVQYSIDLGSLSAEGKNFSINLLKNLLNCDSLWECLVEACSCNSVIKSALETIKTLILLKLLSIDIRRYCNPNNYEIEILLLYPCPKTKIILKDSGVVFYYGNFYYGETSNPSELIGWIKHRNIIA